jgi:hypothetical protein
VKLGLVAVLAGAALLLEGCAGTPPWTAHDTVSATDAVKLGQTCDAVCLSDAGCPPDVAAGCFEAIDCNVGSMLARHGQSDLGTQDAGCAP